MSTSQDCKTSFKYNLTCIFLSLRAKLKNTLQCETPCRLYCHFLQVNLCQKLLFLQNMGRTCCLHKLFWMSKTQQHSTNLAVLKEFCKKPNSYHCYFTELPWFIFTCQLDLLSNSTRLWTLRASKIWKKDRTSLLIETFSKYLDQIV